MARYAVFWIIGLLLGAVSGQAAAQERLPSLTIDPQKISVSGISSGAFMADQFQIAHSELVMGAGLVAGGLYSCAVLSVDFRKHSLNGNVTRALDRCMAGKAPLEPAESYRARIAELAEAGWIDPIAGLAGDRVYLFTGRNDTTVNHATVERAAELYLDLGVALKDIEVKTFLDGPSPGIEAGHAWVTEDCCQPCAVTGPPFINDCDYDQSGAVLKHIYGPLQPKAETLSGRFIVFDQKEFAPGGRAEVNGLNDSGVAYVPAACAAGERCALHVVLHGCRQSSELLGDGFYTKIGMNEWADTNRIVVLYPQAHSIELDDLFSAYPGRWFRNSFAVNPKGCWNWWGYGYDDRFALKDGVQITTLYQMVRRLTGTDGS